VRYRLEIPASDGGVAVRDFVKRWVDQSALRELVEHDGGSWPAGDLATQVDALHDFSARWDFRGGAERLDIGHDGHDLDGPAISAFGTELGMTVAAPPADPAYDASRRPVRRRVNLSEPLSPVKISEHSASRGTGRSARVPPDRFSSQCASSPAIALAIL
jgi:hypothetical protein